MVVVGVACPRQDPNPSFTPFPNTPKNETQWQARLAAHLHVAVLVPELVHAREQRHSTVPHVSGVVGKLAPHLELCVAQPYRLVKKWNTKRAFGFGVSALPREHRLAAEAGYEPKQTHTPVI